MYTFKPSQSDSVPRVSRSDVSRHWDKAPFNAHRRQGRIPDDAFEGEEGTYDADDLANELFASPPPEQDGEVEGTNVEAFEDAEVGGKRPESEIAAIPPQSGSLPESLPETHQTLVD